MRIVSANRLRKHLIPLRAPVTLNDTFTLPVGSTYVPGDKIIISKPANTGTLGSSSIFTFPVSNGKTFRIKLYGGAGGHHDGDSSLWGFNFNGGILDVDIDLSAYADTDLYIVRGGGGQNADGIDGSTSYEHPGGYNGGGYGSGTGGAGGGGRTDLRTGDPGTSASTNSQTELLVAGGGGGGLGTWANQAGRYAGAYGGSGMAGAYAKDNAGGGSGYYGGGASDSDDGRNGRSGTNYYDVGKTSVVNEDTFIVGTTGGNEGHGYFEIEILTI